MADEDDTLPELLKTLDLELDAIAHHLERIDLTLDLLDSRVARLEARLLEVPTGKVDQAADTPVRGRH